MADENLQDALTPTPTPPPGSASSRGQKLRPKILRDRPVIDPAVSGPADPDPEARNQQFRNQLRFREPTPGTPEAYQPFYDPNRFNYGALRSPYARDMFRDEIASQAQEDSAKQRAQVARRREAERRHSEIQSQLKSERDSELAAEKERQWNIAKLEKARTGREYVEDPDRPGFPRPVLSSKEWKAELEAKKAGETAEKTKERRAEIENRAKGYLSGYDAQLDSAETNLTDSQYEERRTEIANQILASKDIEISDRLKEAKKNIGIFKWGAKEKKAKQEVADLEAERERLNSMRIDPDYVDKILSENAEDPLIDSEFRKEQENRSIRADIEAKRNRLNELKEQWKGNLKGKPRMSDEEFEKWLEGDHSEDQEAAPTGQVIEEKKKEIAAKQIAELPYFERQVEVAKLGLQGREIWAKVESIDAEIQGRMASLDQQTELVDSLRESAGTTSSGQQITSDEIRAQHQKLQQLRVDAEILSVRKQAQVDSYNEVIRAQNRVAALAESTRQSGKPVNESVVEVKPFPEDREAWVKEGEAAVKGPDPRPYLGSSYPAWDAGSVEQASRNEKAASRRLAERRAIATNPNAVGELVVNGADIGWVEESVLPNGDRKEVWKVYRDQLQTAMPAAAGRSVQIVERPERYFSLGEALLDTSVYDPFAENYAVPTGQDPETIKLVTNHLRAALSGQQAEKYANDPHFQITPEAVEAVLGQVEQHGEKFKSAIQKSGVQDILNQVAAGTIDQAKGEELYQQKIKSIYGQDGLGEERKAIVSEILRMRDAAFTGGGDLSQVIDIARKAGMPIEPPAEVAASIDRWMDENGVETPLSSDYADALADYQAENASLVLYDPLAVQDVAETVAVMAAREEDLKNRLAEKNYSKVQTGEAVGMYGVSAPLYERRDIELSLEEDAELNEMIRQEASASKWSLAAFADSPARILVGATHGAFGMKGAVEIGHMMGPGDSFDEVVRRPVSQFPKYGSELGIWTEDTIRRTGLGSVGSDGPKPPEKINAIQYRDALETFRKSQAFDRLPEDRRQQIAMELTSVKATLGQDIANNPLYRGIQKFEESVRGTTNPMYDRNHFSNLLTGSGSMIAFMLPAGAARKALAAPGSVKGAGLFRKAVPEERLFGINQLPTQGGFVSNWYGLTAAQGGLLNVTEAFDRIEQVANKAAADPNLDFDQQVSADKSAMIMALYAIGGMTEGMPISKALNRIDMTKVPPTVRVKVRNAFTNTLEETLQEGVLAFANTAMGEAAMPTPEAMEINGETVGYDLSRRFSERFSQRLSEDGVQIMEEGAIGGIMGLAMSFIENGAISRKFKRAKRRQDNLIDMATRATEAKLESLQGEDAGEAIYENMPEGSVPPSKEEVDEVNATYGGSREAAKPGEKSVAVMQKELEDANRKYGWDSPQAHDAEMALTTALAWQGEDAGRRMGRQVSAIRENAEQLAQIDEDIATAEKQFLEAQKSGGFVAAAEAEQALIGLRAERVKIQQAHIATKIAQGRSEYLSDAEWDLVRNGDEEVGVGPAIEDFEGVPVVNQEIVDWAAQNAPAQAALVEMSRDETVQRIKDGRMGELPTPELEQELPLPSERFSEAEAREKALMDTPLDERIGELPEYDPRMFRAGTGKQTPGEFKIRQAGPRMVEGIAAQLSQQFPNLPPDQIRSIAAALVERIAQRVARLDGAFRNVEVGPNEAGPAAVTGTGNLKIDPAQLLQIAIARLAEGASLQEAIDYMDAVVNEEASHNIVRWLLRDAGGDQRVAEIWNALSEESQKVVREGYFNYWYNKAKKDDGIDLSSIPIENWPEKYQQVAERAIDPVYMGHEYLNMVIEEARDGQVSVALLPPRNFWEKLLDLLESLAEAIGLTLQDPNLDPDIRQQIEAIRDWSIEAMNQIESGALNLFAEEKTPDTIKTPKDRLEHLREAGVPLMVAAQYRRTGVPPQDLIKAAEAGIRRVVQKGGANWAEASIQGAQAEIERMLEEYDIPEGSKPGTIRPTLLEKILSKNATSEREAWKYGEVIVEDIIKTLPTRQKEVAERILRGRSTKQIAKELGINTKAVENILKEAHKNIRKELDRAAKVRDRQQASPNRIDHPFPTDRFGADQGAAPRDFPQPRTILAGNDLDTDLYIPTGYKHAKWGEGNKNDLTWTEDPANIRSMDHDPDVDAVITGVFRYGTGVTGMEMLAWLRSELGGDAKIEVADVVPDAEGFYQKAVEYELIDDYFPKYSEEYWADDEVPIQNAALRETPEEMAQIWSDSHPATKNPDGTPIAWYRGHFDDDLFSIPSRPDSFLGPGVYFSNNVHDASQYADLTNHPDGAGEEIQAHTAQRIMDEEEIDYGDALLKAQETMAVENAPRITPVYLHGKKWFRIMPYEADQPMWSFNIDWELDAYQEDAYREIEDFYGGDYEREVEQGEERSLEEWINEEYEDEIKERAQEMAWETNYDPKQTGEIAELLNGILAELRDSFTAEETLLEFGEFGIAELRERIDEAKSYLSQEGETVMTMTEVAQRIFGLNPLTPQYWSGSPNTIIPDLRPGLGGFLLGLGLKRMGYDGIMMDASNYFPNMAEVNTRDTVHAMVFDAKPVYGMFGGTIRKRRDPLQWAAKRAGVEEVAPDIRSKKSDIVDVARGKIYSQDMGTVTVRELLQNSLDAIRPQILKGQDPKDHKLTLFLDPENRTVELTDTGHGMPPEVMASAMIDITKSVKETDGAGGYGLAKAVIFGNSEEFEVETVYQERDGSWSKTTMTGDAQKWENTINEDPGGVQILTERNFNPGEGLEAKEVQLPNEWITGENGDLTGKYLPTGDALPKGIQLKHNGYTVNVEVSPQVIPDLPEVFQNEESIEEMASIIADDENPISSYLNEWVTLWLGDDRSHDSPENIKYSVKQYRGWVEDGISLYTIESRKFIETFPVFGDTAETSATSDVARSFNSLLGYLPPPLQKKIYDHWVERFSDTGLRPINQEAETVEHEWNGITLRGRFTSGDDPGYMGTTGITPEQSFFRELGWTGSDEHAKFAEALKEYLSSGIESSAYVTEKPSTYTRVRSKIHKNVQFNFALAEETFSAVGDNDTVGVEFEIGVTSPGRSVDDLSNRTKEGRKNIRRIRNTSKELEPIKEVNHTEARYKVYRSKELVSGQHIHIQVLNRGIWQFEKVAQIDAQVRVPKKLVIDVHPNLDPKHDNYPFTAGRDDFHNYASWRHKEFYKDLANDAMLSKNQMLRQRWDASPNMTLPGVRRMKVVDVSGKNTSLVAEIANHEAANKMFAKMAAAFTRVQMALRDNGFTHAEKGDLIAWNIGQDAVGVNYKTKAHVGEKDITVIGNKEHAISLDPSIILNRALKNSQYLGLDQMGSLAKKMAADTVVTVIHELTHNGGYGDASDTFSYQLTENITRIAIEQMAIINDLAGDLETLLEETDLQQFLERVDSQQDSSDDHDYAVFIQGTPTGRDGANKRLGRSLGSAPRQSIDEESTEGSREGDTEAAGGTQPSQQGLPGLQEAASRQSINRRSDAFGNTRDRAGRLIEVSGDTKWPEGSGPNGGWNVLSLFDGIAAGRQALKNLGVPVDNYYGAEIEKPSIAIAKHNFPDIQELGDVTKVTGKELPKVDLFWGGSPCQGFSRAGRRKGMEDPRSKLFWDWVRLWKATAPRWFLLENVRMKAEDEEIITRALGVAPIRINGNLLTGANRDRLYWTNIPVTQPKDIGVELKHVIQPRASKDLLWNRSQIDKHMSMPGAGGRVRWNNSQHSDVKRPKAMALVKSLDKGYPQNLLVDKQGQYRKFSMVEAARLMGFPDEYLRDVPEVANGKKYAGAGNSWAVPVIEHIIQHVATQPKGLQGSAQRLEADEIAQNEYQMHAISMSGGLVHRVKHPDSVKWHVEVGRPERRIIGMFDDPRDAASALSIWAVSRDLSKGDVIRSIDHGGRTFEVVSTDDYVLRARDRMTGEEGELDFTRVFRTRTTPLNAAKREMQPWPMSFPEVQSHSTLVALKGKKGSEKEARHKRAKAGDVDAALEIVTEVMKPEKAQELASLYPGAVLATPNSQEGDSTNAIPEAMAAWISHLTGMPMEESLHEVGKASHTKANAWERLFRVPQYGGEIDPTKEYVLVDDVSTSGSTLNAMRSYIQQQGGTVVGAVAIASPNSPQNGPGWVLQPTSEALVHLDNYYRDGDKGGIEAVSELLLNHGLSSVATLTNSQIWLLAGGKPNRKKPVEWTLEDLDRRLKAGREAEENRQSQSRTQGAARRSTDLWGKPKQRFSSKNTARGNAGGLPAGYRYLKEKELVNAGDRVLDIGTGPFRHADAAVEEMGGEFYSYEPWWDERVEDTDRAIANATDGRSDIVISNNVLNVIPEKTNQVRLIRQAENALKQGGKFYLTIYQAPKKGQVGERDQFQAGEPLSYYKGMVETVFGKGNVQRDGQVLIATKVGNMGATAPKLNAAERSTGRKYVAADINGTPQRWFDSRPDAEDYFRTMAGRGEFLWRINEKSETFIGGIPMRSLSPAGNGFEEAETPIEAGALPRQSPSGNSVSARSLPKTAIRYGLPAFEKNQDPNFVSEEEPVVRPVPDPNAPHSGDQFDFAGRYKFLYAAPRMMPAGGTAPKFTSKLTDVINEKVGDKAGSQHVAGIIGQWQVHGQDGKVKKKFPSTQRDKADKFAEEISGEVRWQGPVSAEEVEWSGITDFLEANPKSVTKQELLDFLESTRPEIKEITLISKGLGAFGDDGEVENQKYSTPGGSNYRELLFTYEPYQGTRTSLFTKDMGSHWKQPNVMYHARVSDRETADGKSVLYVNEIQSDWHQKGKSKGYRGGENAKEFRALYDKAFGGDSMDYGAREDINKVRKDGSINRGAGIKTPRPAERLSEEENARLFELAKEQGQDRGRVPYAPWGDTWQQLAVRRLIQYASQVGGYDAIAFATGNHQIDLNESPMRQRIDRIETTKLPQGEDGEIQKMVGDEAWLQSKPDDILITKNAGGWLVDTKKNLIGGSPVSPDLFRKSDEVWVAKPTQNELWENQRISYNNNHALSRGIEEAQRVEIGLYPDPDSEGWNQHGKIRFKVVSPYVYHVQVRNNIHGNDQLIYSGLDAYHWTFIRGYNQAEDANVLSPTDLPRLQSRARFARNEIDQSVRVQNNEYLPVTDETGMIIPWREAEIGIWRSKINSMKEAALERNNLIQVEVYPKRNPSSPSLTVTVPSSGSISKYGKDISLDDVALNFAEDARKAPEGEKQTFSGENLSIGGKMHRMIYDVMVPSILRKIGKRHDVKPEIQPILYRDPDQQQYAVEQDQDATSIAFDRSGEMIGTFEENFDRDEFDSDEAWETFMEDQGPYVERGGVPNPERRMDIDRGGETLEKYPVFDAVVMGLPEALQEETRQGVPLFAAKRDSNIIIPEGKKSLTYDLLKSPWMEQPKSEVVDPSIPDWDNLHYLVTKPAREAIEKAISDGHVDSAAARLVEETKRMLKYPDVAAGTGWYGRMRKKLRSSLEDDHEIFTHLLGTTSAQTPVELNFQYAVEALLLYKRGKFDRQIKKYLEFINFENPKAARKVMDKRGITDPSEILTDPQIADRWVTHYNLLPRRQNGGLFGSNSYPTLKALSGVWMSDNMTPKTPQFAMNLYGSSLEATIDLWAARTLRRIMWGDLRKQWRIQPMHETGVKNEDFALGQVIFRRAANILGMEPDDLQAVVWFGEKHIWEEEGWTGEIGALKSSFDDVADVFFPDGRRPRQFKHGQNIVRFIQKERLYLGDILSEDDYKSLTPGSKEYRKETISRRQHEREYREAAKQPGVPAYIKSRGFDPIRDRDSGEPPTPPSEPDGGSDGGGSGPSSGAGPAGDLGASLRDVPEPMGVNINDSSQPFTSQILSGEKTIETRNSDSLRPYVGKRVGIVRTGVGKATLVGYADVGEPTLYLTEEQFRRDEGKHLVQAGSDYDFKEKKWGYPLTNVEKTEPRELDSKGIVSRSLGAAERDLGNIDEEGADAARILSEEVDDLAEFIKMLEARKGQVEGEVETAVPRLANISGDENVRAAHSVVQWAYDQEREKLNEPDMMAEGRRMADETPAAVERAILEAGANRTTLGSPEMVYAAKAVLSRAWRDATASGDPEAISRAQVLSHAYQRTRTEVARELAAGRDPSKTPAERHAEMIASFMGFSEHSGAEDRRIRDLAKGSQRRDRIREVHKLISQAKSPEEANRYKNELRTLKEAIRAAEVDAEVQQKRMETAKNVLGTYGVTLRDIFDGDRIRAARQAPAVKSAIERMRSQAGKDAARMILNRQPNKKIQKKLGITEEKIRQFEEDFRKALRLEFGKAAQQMAQRNEQGRPDDLVLVPEDVRNGNRFHGDEGGQFDVSRPEHAVWAARTLATLFNGNAYNAINEFWINSILSGPQTQAINVFSNGLNLAWDKTIETGLEAMFNLIVPGDKTQGAQFGDVRRFWEGFSKGVAPAWRNAVASFKNDGLDFFEAWAMQEPVARFDVSKVESAYLPSIKGAKGRLIRTPGNALQAMDTLFKTSIASGEVAVQAYRIANAQLKVGDITEAQMGGRIAELMEHGSPAWILAMEKAKELTFTREFQSHPDASKREKWMSMVQSFRSGRIRGAEESMIKLGLSFLFPFIRTPYRIFEIGLRKAPVTGTANLLYKVIKSGIATYGPNGSLSFNANYGEMGRSELVRDITEQAIASVAMALLVGAAEGDEDDEDKELLIVGSRPYAPGGHGERELANRLYGSSTIIRIGGRDGVHIDYGRYEPISTVLASMIDMIREFKRNPNTDGQTWLVNLGGSLANQAQEKTFLQGIRTIADTVTMANQMLNREPEKAQEQIEKTAKEFLRGFVPNLIRQPLRHLDPVPRDRSGYLYALTNAGAFGLPKHDLYGRDLEKTLVGPARLLVRTPTDADDLHPGDAFLSSLSIRRPDLVSTFPTSWGGSTTNKFKNSLGEWEDMTDEQRNVFSKLAGQKFSLKVNQWADPMKMRRPTEDDLKDFKALLSAARREAKDQLFVNGQYVGPTR